SVDSTGAVEQRHAMLERKSRTRTDLRLVTVRQLKFEAGRQQSASARSKIHRLAYGSDQSETCVVLRVVSGKRQTLPVRQGAHADRNRSRPRLSPSASEPE